jgi:hypothetical protein
LRIRWEGVVELGVYRIDILFGRFKDWRRIATRYDQ